MTMRSPFIQGVKLCIWLYLAVLKGAHAASLWQLQHVLYLIIKYSAHTQHLLCEMISMVPNDRAGPTTYSLFIHCLSSLIAIRANEHGGVIRHGDAILFGITLCPRA